MTRKAVFDAIKQARGKGFTADEVPMVDALLDRLSVPKDEASGVRRIGPRGLALIKESEGLRLKAYKDAVGVWTIGYGSTGAHVKPGMVITEAQADALLKSDLDRFEKAVARYVGKNATDGQFDALVSFAFNVGEGDGGLKTSTLLRLHNEEDYAAAAEQFARWNKAGGRVLPGLTSRRAKEARLYRSAA